MTAPQFLFGGAGRAELRALLADSAVFAFDFDGTLAPIVARPDDARMPAGIERRLAQLAARVPTAVISGRRRDDVAARLPPSVRWVIGNHGNEAAAVADEGDARRRAGSEAMRRWRAQLAASAELARLQAEGVTVEDKDMSFALHYRLARDPAAAEAALRALAVALDPPAQLIGGKRVLNLLPPALHTKYEALAALIAQTGARSTLFVGDDDTDEQVFERAPPHWVTVRVQRVPGTRARWFVHEQASLAALLDFLLQELDRQPPLRRM